MTHLPRFTSIEAYVPTNEKRIEIDQSNLDTIYMSNFLFTIVIFLDNLPHDKRDKKKLFKNFVRLMAETPVNPVVKTSGRETHSQRRTSRRHSIPKHGEE